MEDKKQSGRLWLWLGGLFLALFALLTAIAIASFVKDAHYSVLLNWWMLGALLAFLTSWVTLSFLFTTPEAWVPALGDGEHGFPYLSGGGRLVLKDVMLWAGSFLLLVESAKASGIDPIAYLTEVATRTQESPGAVLLPADFTAAGRGLTRRP